MSCCLNIYSSTKYRSIGIDLPLAHPATLRRYSTHLFTTVKTDFRRSDNRIIRQATQARDRCEVFRAYRWVRVGQIHFFFLLSAVSWLSATPTTWMDTSGSVDCCYCLLLLLLLLRRRQAKDRCSTRAKQRGRKVTGPNVCLIAWAILAIIMEEGTREEKAKTEENRLVAAANMLLLASKGRFPTWKLTCIRAGWLLRRNDHPATDRASSMGNKRKNLEHQAGFRDVLLVRSLCLFTLYALGCLLANSKDCCSCSARRQIINEMHLCPSIETHLKRDPSSMGTAVVAHSDKVIKGSLLMLFSCQVESNQVTQRTGPPASRSRSCGRKGLWSDRCLHLLPLAWFFSIAIELDRDLRIDGVNRGWKFSSTWMWYHLSLVEW